MRWKCPDCGGWVAESVGVHYCIRTYGAGTSLDPSGYQCSGCGGWYVGVHICSRVLVNT